MNRMLSNIFRFALTWRGTILFPVGCVVAFGLSVLISQEQKGGKLDQPRFLGSFNDLPYGSSAWYMDEWNEGNRPSHLHLHEPNEDILNLPGVSGITGLKLGNSVSDVEGRQRFAALTCYIDLLSKTDRLTELRLVGFLIDEEMVRTITNISSLKKIHFDFCLFTHSIAAFDKLKSLEYVAITDSEIDRKRTDELSRTSTKVVAIQDIRRWENDRLVHVNSTDADEIITPLATSKSISYLYYGDPVTARSVKSRANSVAVRPFQCELSIFFVGLLSLAPIIITTILLLEGPGQSHVVCLWYKDCIAPLLVNPLLGRVLFFWHGGMRCSLVLLQLLTNILKILPIHAPIVATITR